MTTTVTDKMTADKGKYWQPAKTDMEPKHEAIGSRSCVGEVDCGSKCLFRICLRSIRRNRFKQHSSWESPAIEPINASPQQRSSSWKRYACISRRRNSLRPGSEASLLGKTKNTIREFWKFILIIVILRKTSYIMVKLVFSLQWL